MHVGDLFIPPKTSMLSTCGCWFGVSGSFTVQQLEFYIIFSIFLKSVCIKEPERKVVRKKDTS